jgi:hypothetical protein
VLISPQLIFNISHFVKRNGWHLAFERLQRMYLAWLGNSSP